MVANDGVIFPWHFSKVSINDLFSLLFLLFLELYCLLPLARSLRSIFTVVKRVKKKLPGITRFSGFQASGLKKNYPVNYNLAPQLLLPLPPSPLPPLSPPLPPPPSSPPLPLGRRTQGIARKDCTRWIWRWDEVWVDGCALQIFNSYVTSVH